MGEKTPIFDKIYRDYLKRINQLDLRTVAEKFGGGWTGEGIALSLFGKIHQISERGILGPSGKEPSHSVRVVLCQYILLHPSSRPEGETWVSYKDFRGSAPFAGAFHNNAEAAIAKNFTGRLKTLKESCFGLGGYAPTTNWAYDLQIKFDALPKVPILLLFNDAETEFPARCLLLFEQRAYKYLDMECLAVLGWLLADYLGESSEKAPPEKR